MSKYVPKTELAPENGAVIDTKWSVGGLSYHACAAQPKGKHGKPPEAHPSEHVYRGLFRSITKFSAEIDAPQAVSEVIANAFRAAESGRSGAAFISAPYDIMTGEADGVGLPWPPLCSRILLY